MAHQHHPENRGIGGFLRSRTGLALIAFLLIAAFYLFTEHTAHTFTYLPFGLLLLCLFLHLFMHGGHGGQSNADDHSGHQISRPNGGPQ